jgi:hypothetical protein
MGDRHRAPHLHAPSPEQIGDRHRAADPRTRSPRRRTP